MNRLAPVHYYVENYSVSTLDYIDSPFHYDSVMLHEWNYFSKEIGYD
jgi:hypothetical protein